MTTRSCALTAFLFSLAPMAAALEVVRGPYVQLATPSSITVVWRTNEAIAPSVRIGPAPATLAPLGNSLSMIKRVSVDVAAHSDGPFADNVLLYDEPLAIRSQRSPEDADPSTPGMTYQYEATITGLEPSTKYFYGVFAGQESIAGGDLDHHFTTSPEAGEKTETRIWVVGDSGTGGLDQRRVHQAMREFTESTNRQLDLYLHLGDMAYGDGADVEFQDNFFEIYQSTLRSVVCWPTMGNHEGHTSRGISQFGPYYDAYVVPIAGEAGGAPSGTEAYYSFDHGNIHFICLDSHDLDRSPDGAMAQWLIADLEQATSDWMIAFWHHPPYTKGSHDSDRELQLIEMRTHIMPLLEAGGVDLVMSGHSHIYERSMLIDGAYATPTTAEGVILDDGDGDPEGDGAYKKSEGLRPHNGTIAIVAGHGGAGVSRKGTMPIMRKIIVENGSLLLDIEGATLTGTMLNKEGEVRDEFQLVKSGRVEHSPISDPWTPKHDPSQITEMLLDWSADTGGFPSDWSASSGETERMVIKQREGTPYVQAEVETGEEAPFGAVYEKFSGGLGELEGWLEIQPGDSDEAGLVFGWKDWDNYYAFVVCPSRGTASLVKVASGKRSVVTQRQIDLDLSKPLKIELEPSESLIEVQISDKVEYTIKLGKPLPEGRIGIETGAGVVARFAGIQFEKKP